MGLLTSEVKDILNSMPRITVNNGVIKPLDIPENEAEQDAIPWPENHDDAAYYGLAGDVVKTIMPYTEADPAAVLMNFLVGFGNVIGKTAYFVADREHYTNLFAMLVGASGVGKKGTSWSHVKKLFTLVDSTWTHKRVLTGLSSGEGVIFAVRDAVEKVKVNHKTKETELVVEDFGEVDKRLLLIESEFGKGLQSMRRDGNTLSATLRQIWDSDYLIQSLTKSSQTKATNAHISVIGHITKEELNSLLQEVELINGLGNRFLWCCCRKSKSIPFPEPIPETDLNWLAAEIRSVIDFENNCTAIGMTEAVKKAWPVIYEELEKPKTGILGAVLARGVPLVRRLAVIYAVLDKSPAVDIPHLMAALAIWKRSEQSAEYIFNNNPQDAEQSKVEAEILECLQTGEKTQTEIRDFFNRNKPAAVINKALENLSGMGKVVSRNEKKPDARKGTTFWKLAKI